MTVIALGLDTGVLTRLSSATASYAEQRLISVLDYAREHGGNEAHAAEQELAGPLTALLNKSPWVNAQPLHVADIKGKVVLVSFWTYSCINCLRVLPYLRAWAEKYKEAGLVVVGVHTPEFAFEKDFGNVRRAVSDLGVKYPVVLDNDFGIWRAFGNRAWPALYFVNADGRITRHVFGEGNYEQSEQLIQELLTDARGAPVYMDMAGIVGQGSQAPPDERNLLSPETYIGYQEANSFVSPGGFRRDKAADYAAPVDIPMNRWALQGRWTVGPEFASLDGQAGSIRYTFHARDLHLVLAPRSDGRPVRFRVTVNSMAPGADHGFDTDAEGFGEVDASRLYQLIRQAGPVAQKTFEIEFLDPGVRAYAFTFG